MFRRDHDHDGDGRTEQVPSKEVRMAEQGAEATVVGQGAKLEGTIESAGSLRIDGQVKGTINAESEVVLSQQSHVEADINATNVTVAGRFKGNIVAKNRAEISRGGRVDGNITSKTLVVAEGASFSGQSVMDDGSGRGGTTPVRPEAAVPAAGSPGDPATAPARR